MSRKTLLITLCLALMAALPLPAASLSDVAAGAGAAADAAGGNDQRALAAAQEAAENPVEADTVEAGVEKVLEVVHEQGDDGVKLIRTPNGVAVTATGVADFALYENPDASELSKRSAYAKAYIAAQASLIEYRRGVSVERSISSSDARKDRVTEQETLVNSSSSLNERIDRTLGGQLDSFVVADVHDFSGKVEGKEPDCRVSVTLAISETLRNKVHFVTPGVVEAGALADALESLKDDIQHSVLPPIGARVAALAGMDQVAVLAFGSEYVLTGHGRSLSQAKMIARRRAEARGEASLVEFLRGTNVEMKYGLVAGEKESRKEFEEIRHFSEDRLGNKILTDVELRKLEQVEKTFDHEKQDEETRRAVSAGRVPPGVSKRFYFSRDNKWCFCVCIYNRQVTDEVKKMDAALSRPLPGGGAPEAVSAPQASPSADAPARRKTPPAGPRKNYLPERGPSGRVQDLSIL